MAEAGLILGSVKRASRDTAMSVPRWRVEKVPVAEAAPLTGAWERLAAEASESNPLFAPDFVLAAAQRFGAGVVIAAVRGGDGNLAALAPTTPTRLGRIAPALRVWSHDYGPLGVPLLAASDAQAAAAGLIAAADGGALVVPDLALDGPAARALVAAAAASGRAVTVAGQHERAIFRTGVDPREALSAKRRKEYGRQLRRLAEDGAVAQETITEPEAVRAAFEEFLELEARGWKGARGTAMAAQADKSAFAREAVAGLAARGRVVINTLRLDGRMLAGLVSLVARDAAVTWKIAYDESFARYSPGAQVMLDAPVALAARGVTYIDSLATPDHPLINHIWKDRAAIGTLIIAPARGQKRHRLALKLMAAEVRARALAKRLRDRLRG